ncbi:uncharacterized protein PV09_04773 [Verruconis gallopava]|uniref:IEC3 subunit of the Ino80 complex, chromatin re-modelling-domain-containing protein n=1 Tax=Verruconis gallopava TaxID=253628 RepID=A0A0D2AXP0_9PEZI|nr:uncharacterized protein PV09_04773 [Verruconis gallopava]KIW03934.1 hypothetical protein PV09_04773 [Verruconis gallopava]
MSLENLMNPKPATPPDAQKFDDVLKDQKIPLRSWRKKYRKMKLNFDKVMDESNTLFRDCHKLEAQAKRLQEENDQHLETLLHLNETARMYPRYDLGDPHEDVVAVPSADAVPPLDPDTPRSLAMLLNVPHTTPSSAPPSTWPSDMTGDAPPGYLTTAYEEEYVTNLDAQLGVADSLDDGWRLPQLPRSRILPPEKELLNANPMSVLSWLRRYHPETFIQEKEAAAEKAGKGKGGASASGGTSGGKRSSLATITSMANDKGTPNPRDDADDADDDWVAEERTSGRGKRSKDDEAYRPKGGSSRPTKRKRDEGEKSGRNKRVKGGAAAAAAAAAAASSTPG